MEHQGFLHRLRAAEPSVKKKEEEEEERHYFEEKPF